MNTRHLIAAVLFAASGAAFADDSRAPTGVGAWIAAQGNAALREIAEELKENLAESVRPLLPPSNAPKQRPSASAEPVLIAV